MRIIIYGTTYDTSHMRTFLTGDPKQPTIYIDQGCRVFVERVDGGKTVVHWASTTEIEKLAALYGISELRRATRHADFTVDPRLVRYTVPEGRASGEAFQVRAAWGMARRTEGGRRDQNPGHSRT